MTINMNIAGLLIGAALIATTPAAARTIAAPNGDKLRAVRYADLDLATSGGRATLDRRIAIALESVCGSYANLLAEEQIEVTRCRRDAKAKLAPKLAELLGANGPARSAMLGR